MFGFIPLLAPLALAMAYTPERRQLWVLHTVGQPSQPFLIIGPCTESDYRETVKQLDIEVVRGESRKR
jgi:hypothetical protein